MGRAEARASLGLAIAITALICAAPGAAWGDGAFPDAQNILLPVDRPDHILMPTNFGVVFSVDGGHTWLWTCEQELNGLGWLYQVGLPPRRRIFNVANEHLVYSDDMTCGWRIAGGALAGQEVRDAWVDRALPDRVFSVGVRCCEGNNNIYSLFASNDGGATFGAALYVAPSGDTISGIESSLSDPQTVYMTMSVGPQYEAVLARSTDGGATWKSKSLTASLGKGNARLIAVDPRNPAKVFLLWNDPVAGQAVAVTDDGGATATIRLPPTGDGAVIKAFVQTASDALLVATDLNSVATLHRSINGGISFSVVAGAPHIRGLAQRGGMTYAATDNFADGFAMATSTDDGSTWTPLMSYDKVGAIAGCLKAACQDSCAMEVPLLWPANVCSADAPGGAAGSPVGGSGMGGGAGRGGTGGKAGGGGGSGCRVTPVGLDDASNVFVLVALALWLSSRRMGSRRRRR